MNLFSHCVLTASDERQAEAFRSLLSRRIQHGLYPREIAFHVYPDPPGRVGSGAGTLWALHRLYQEIGYDPQTHAGSAAPSVLVLHAAGESRRLPVFAPEGKLFAPVPVASSSVLPPVVLDLQLDPYLFEEPEYHGRMTLYYTGVTRLAKNILQEVVDRVNQREPAFLFTHEYLRSLAREARSAIALRDYPRLTGVIRGSWRANKLIHASTTNEDIETLLSSTAEHWSAIKLLGAGGGGYGLFLSDTVDQANRLRDALAAHAADSPSARLVEFSLSRPGLQVSVS